MSKTLRYISMILVFCFILIAVSSCAGNQETTQTEKGTETTQQVQTQAETVETTNPIETTETTSSDPVIEPTGLEYSDNKVFEIGSYVKITYNPEMCEVKSSVKKGLGASEQVTLEVVMKNGYIYNGITKDEYIDNYPDVKFVDKTLTAEQKIEAMTVAKDTSVTFDVSEDMMLYVNYNLTVIYHLNGGKFVDNGVKKDGESYVDYYPVSHYKCPVSLKAGTFVKDGYVLSEYATDEYGEETVSVGSRFVPSGSECHVYCIWEEANKASDFTYRQENGGIILTGFKGTGTNVVIPEEIDGKPVVKISSNTFTSDDITRIFVPRTVTNIENKAFAGKGLTTLVLHDSITSMQDGAFASLQTLKSLRINTVQELFEDWCRSTYVKMDRLLWAKDMKKIVIYGGSGSWYGWDCEELTKEFGDEYCIINLGMNANMCSCVFIEGFSGYMNEGDILLWASEPGSYLLGDPTFNSKTWWFIFSSFDIFRNVDISAYRNVFSSFASFNTEHMSKPMSAKRSRATSNPYGDDISVRENQFTTANYRFTYFFNPDYAHLGDVLYELNERGVKVLYTYAAMAEDCPGLDDNSLDSYKENLLKYFDMEIISDYHDCMYPNSMFWNSEWHMTNEGAHERTLHVIEDLKAYFENNK